MDESEKNISFMHTADLHLGAPLLSMNALDDEVSKNWKNIISSAVYDSFACLIDKAIKNAVDFFIVSGDVFDSKNISYKDFLYFCTQMEKLKDAGIRAFVCAGNHDPASSWQKTKAFGELPSNVYFFDADKFSAVKFKSKKLCDIAIYGQSFESTNAPDSSEFLNQIKQCIDIDDKSFFKIGVLHTGLNVDMQNYPIDVNTLDKANIDYWALGHIHQNATYSMQNSTLSFPGCVQGLHINAKGVDDKNTKGAFGGNLVVLSKDSFSKTKIDITFIASSQVLWKKLNIDVSDCENINSIENKILHTLEHLMQESKSPFICYRVKLLGQSILHKELSLSKNLENLKNRLNNNNNNCLCEEVIDISKNIYDYKKLTEQDLFAAKVLKSGDINLNNITENKEYLIQKLNKAKFSVDLEKIYNLDIANYIERAKEKALDLVMG